MSPSQATMEACTPPCGPTPAHRSRPRRSVIRASLCKRWWPLAGASAVLLGSLVSSVQAAVVERIVAVVGDRAILLSELQMRARPFERQIEASTLEGPARATAVSQLYKDLAERLVDEELQAKAATRSNITVDPDEIQRASERLATQNGLSVEDLYAEAERTGLNRAEYRLEIQRQLLEAKLLNLRMQGRVRIGEDDMRSAYRRAQHDERERLGFRIAWIRMAFGAGSDGVTRTERAALTVTAQARSGADFSALVARYSQDEASKATAGLLPPLRHGQLPAELDNAVIAMEVGDTSEPIRVGNTWVVVRLVERDPSALPPYEEAKPQLQSRVYAEKMDRAKRQWLRTLRRQTHVDVRL